MTRVTRPGGWILALAEPDYGGRIDFPRELEAVGQRQIQGLLDQGANPYLGRTLRSLFVSAQLTEIRTGLLGGEWQGSPGEDHMDLEWETLARDLSHLLPAGEIEHYQRIDRRAWKMGTKSCSYRHSTPLAAFHLYKLIRSATEWILGFLAH